MHFLGRGQAPLTGSDDRTHQRSGSDARHMKKVLSCGDYDSPSMSVFTDVRGPKMIPFPSQPTLPEMPVDEVTMESIPPNTTAP